MTFNGINILVPFPYLRHHSQSVAKRATSHIWSLERSFKIISYKNYPLNCNYCNCDCKLTCGTWFVYYFSVNFLCEILVEVLTLQLSTVPENAINLALFKRWFSRCAKRQRHDCMQKYTWKAPFWKIFSSEKIFEMITFYPRIIFVSKCRSSKYPLAPYILPEKNISSKYLFYHFSIFPQYYRAVVKKCMEVIKKKFCN